MSNEQTSTQTETERPSPAFNTDLVVIKNALMRDPKSSVMFFVRVFTAVSGLLFGIGSLFSSDLANVSFQRTIFAFGLASVIRLSQRLGPIQFSKQYFINVVLEDSAHYFLYACNFYSHNPTTLVGIVPTLYCTLQSGVFLSNTLEGCKNPFWGSVKAQLTSLKANQQKLLRLVATAEIFIMPLVIIQMFLGQCGSILTPLVYYQFLMLRYMSRRNPYVNNAFTELKMSINQLLYNPRCPAFVRSIVTKAMSLIERLSPMTYQPTATPQ